MAPQDICAEHATCNIIGSDVNCCRSSALNRNLVSGAQWQRDVAVDVNKWGELNILRFDDLFDAVFQFLGINFYAALNDHWFRSHHSRVEIVIGCFRLCWADIRKIAQLISSGTVSSGASNPRTEGDPEPAGTGQRERGWDEQIVGALAITRIIIRVDSSQHIDRLRQSNQKRNSRFVFEAKRKNRWIFH